MTDVLEVEFSVKERVELADVIDYAMRDWDIYIDECRETETPPIDSFEDFIADGVLSAGYRKQQWIPVTERLPEMPGKYLVTGRSFRDRIPQVWICECISFGSVIGWSNHALNPIVEAWMPLPTPPKEGDEQQ